MASRVSAGGVTRFACGDGRATTGKRGAPRRWWRIFRRRQAPHHAPYAGEGAERDHRAARAQIRELNERLRARGDAESAAEADAEALRARVAEVERENTQLQAQVSAAEALERPCAGLKGGRGRRLDARCVPLGSRLSARAMKMPRLRGCGRSLQRRRSN